jgi:hypothetical protein
MDFDHPDPSLPALPIPVPPTVIPCLPATAAGDLPIAAIQQLWPAP